MPPRAEHLEDAIRRRAGRSRPEPAAGPGNRGYFWSFSGSIARGERAGAAANRRRPEPGRGRTSPPHPGWGRFPDSGRIAPGAGTVPQPAPRRESASHCWNSCWLGQTEGLVMGDTPQWRRGRSLNGRGLHRPRETPSQGENVTRKFLFFRIRTAVQSWIMVHGLNRLEVISHVRRRAAATPQWHLHPLVADLRRPPGPEFARHRRPDRPDAALLFGGLSLAAGHSPRPP